MPINYTVRLADAAAHIVEVCLDIENPDPAGQYLRISDWTPGSYMIRDYARNIVSVLAQSASGPVTVTKTGKSTWRAAPCEGVLQVVYRVYAWDLSVRSAHVATTHAYFNGVCVFFEVVGQGDSALAVTLECPSLDSAANWRVATSLHPEQVDARGFGRYRAGNYFELIDQPIDIGHHDHGEFEVCGIPHAFAIRGARKFSMQRLLRDVGTLCAEHHKLLGTPRDLDRYVFLAYALDKGYGGLEHDWSSSLAITRSALPRSVDGPADADYRKLLGLISHEYFHLWNVRRMKPAAFTPYDLTRETHTGLLWVFEGITSYYDDLALARSGLVNEAQYLEVLGQQITRVLRVPGRELQTLHESSFDAWTRHYKRDENSDNATISYYTKGALVALALDLRLRTEADRCSLDTVMREAWRRYGESGVGMPERGLEALAAELSGLELDEFFARYVHGTEDPPLRELLRRVGIEMHLREQGEAQDEGGKPLEKPRTLPWLGLTHAGAAHAVAVATTLRNGPAQRAGIASGDEIVAIDGLRATPATLSTLLGRYKAGERIAVDLFRRDELLHFELTLGAAPKNTCYLTLIDDDDAAAERRCWLASAGS